MMATPKSEAKPLPSRNPLPLSSAQEGQVRELYYARVKRKCADEIRGKLRHLLIKTWKLIQTGRLCSMRNQSYSNSDLGMSAATVGNELLHDSACVTAGAGCGQRGVVFYNGSAEDTERGERAKEKGTGKVLSRMVGFG